jgi:hypothetical protein
MMHFQKLIRTFRKSTLDDIVKKAGLKNDDLSKKELIDTIEDLILKQDGKRKFIHTTLFQIGFPILLGFMGFFIGRITDIPNTEVKANIIESNITESVLNSEIKNITLLLDLKKELKPDNYSYEGFLIRIRSSQRTTHDRLEALFVVNKAGNKENGLVWSLVCETFTDNIYNRKAKRTGYSQQPYESALSSIPLPISLRNCKDKPFVRVRDLDECNIELFLPEEILRFTHKVRLVVNSGFRFKKHIMVFEKEIIESDWENTEYKINDNFELEMNLSYKYAKNIGYPNWWMIDISKSTIVSSKNAIPDIFRVDY